MEFLYWTYIVVSGILICFLVWPFLSVCFSFLFKEKLTTFSPNSPDYQLLDYGCIITAYKNAEIAKPLIASLIRQKYNHLHIYLVADECDISGWDLEHDQLTVLQPEPPLRLKAKSIIHAMEHYVRPHDYTIVFDADNLAHPRFMEVIHQYALNGYLSIQGQRTAKNLDTMYACLDATGEFYKNYIDRYVPYRLGSSAVISGSGMAVETERYQAYLASPAIEKGKHQWKKMLQEDKILQNFLLFRRERIAYAWEAVVYDEKVVSGQQVETQRSRWLFSYFQNLPNSSGLLWKGITGLNLNQLLFGWVTIAPPLFIQLFTGICLMVIGIFIAPGMAFVLLAALAIFAGTILWTLQLSDAPSKVWRALWGMPLFVWRQFSALFKMGNPNKHFKHSEHTRNYSIDEVLQKEGMKKE